MFVGVDAHIDPAVRTVFTEIYGENDGSQWGDVGIAPYAMVVYAPCKSPHIYGVCTSCKSIRMQYFVRHEETQNYFSGGAAGRVMRTSVPSP